ncbi:hypothetical protein DPMN_108449 [Dreissena polymorpha]|uniref:Uncharacterized protein n=1 Tax=Dreissena polymorpha TaxID=45954 RepID=A0A9D4K952_DREPO|nr:hypothetical protein DPMN_108449 [Dreissena polymorpha]
MDFHPEKCSILRVHRKRNPIMFCYSLKDHILETDSATKYLEVTLSQNLLWNHYMDIMAKRGTVHSASSSATYASAMRRSRPRHTPLLSGQALSIAPQCGTHLQRTWFTSLRWYRGGLLDT